MEKQNAYLAHIVVEDENPMALYRSWRQVAEKKLCRSDLDAMNLATVSREGRVSNRIVFLQEVEDEGFVFNTCRHGRKVKEIEEHPQVSAVFFWNIPEDGRYVHKQVRIEGKAVELDDSYAQKQFDKSPRHAQIRSVLCVQGQEVEWEDLKERFDKLAKGNTAIVKGDSLVAYKIVPDWMEFYLGASDTIADRVVFKKALKIGCRSKKRTPLVRFRNIALRRIAVRRNVKWRRQCLQVELKIVRRTVKCHPLRRTDTFANQSLCGEQGGPRDYWHVTTMAPNLSKYATRTNALAGASLAAAYLIYRLRKHPKKTSRSRRHNAEEDEVKYMIAEKKDGSAPKAHVDLHFFRQLRRLLAVVVPGWASKESGLFVLVAASLVARSLCDLWLINNGTKIESTIISRNRELFRKTLLEFLCVVPAVSLVNNVLKYSIGELKIRLRTNMTLRLYDDYLANYTYYRMANLDNRIANADQLLTTDVDKFCESLADLYCNLAKPLLDIGIYVYKLTTTLGGQTPLYMLGYLFVSGAVLTRLRRPTGRMTVTEQKLEGEFRHINARIITHSEEIAFYNGNTREKATLIASFNKLLRHLRNFLRFRVTIGVVDNLIAKYFATAVGFCVVSMPFLSGNGLGGDSQTERSRLYYTYGRMLVKLAEAIGRVVLAGRELTRLAGFTARVTQLRSVLDELNAGKYRRTMVAGSEEYKPGGGKLVFKDNVINFDRVPLVTPNGDVLIKELSFEIKSGMNVLVCGPNGAGKSSLFRILGELWPVFGGTVTKPPGGKLFYIPQKPYMTLGSLRDQITYPHSTAEARRRGATDAHLIEHMRRVQLEYLLEREGGLDAVADWLDVLSGGEKQRIAMARLFYHAPQFAILDECTSAVSVDVEGSMYRYCRDVGITLLTVSHRKSLWQHHEHVLHLDGRGGYTYEAIDARTEEFGS